MNPYDATTEIGSPHCCIVCDKPVGEDKWFARVRLSDHRVIICRPWCTEKFAADPAAYAWKLEPRRPSDPGPPAMIEVSTPRRVSAAEIMEMFVQPQAAHT